MKKFLMIPVLAMVAVNAFAGTGKEPAPVLPPCEKTDQVEQAPHAVYWEGAWYFRGKEEPPKEQPKCDPSQTPEQKPDQNPDQNPEQ